MVRNPGVRPGNPLNYLLRLGIRVGVIETQTKRNEKQKSRDLEPVAIFSSEKRPTKLAADWLQIASRRGAIAAGLGSLEGETGREGKANLSDNKNRGGNTIFRSVKKPGKKSHGKRGLNCRLGQATRERKYQPFFGTKVHAKVTARVR